MSGELKLGGVSGLNGQALSFENDGAMAYKAKAHQFSGALVLDAAEGQAPLDVRSAGSTLLAVSPEGALLGSRLGRADARWDAAYLKDTLVVGDNRGSVRVPHCRLPLGTSLGRRESLERDRTAGLELRVLGSKVGLPGADHGLRARDATIAELLKPHGYATERRRRANPTGLRFARRCRSPIRAGRHH